MTVNTHILKPIIVAMAAFTAAIAPTVGLTSCDSVIYDDMPECPSGLRIRFVYDYNMEFANAFPAQVDCLTLHVYDSEGRLVDTFTETTDVLADEGYRMEVDLPAGEYQLVAYGGMECEESSFVYTNGTPAKGHLISDRQVSLRPECLTDPDSRKLHNHFYGDATVTVTGDAPELNEVTVKMKRNTNTIRIILQHLDYTPVDHADYDFELEDDNTVMAHNNDVVPTGTSVIYSPWSRGNIEIGPQNPRQADARADATDIDPANSAIAYAEFSVPRLIHGAGTRLRIHANNPDEDPKGDIDLPIISYLEAARSEYHSSMPWQEYLDRENNWQMTFILDRNNRWLYVDIKVADWTVRINNITFD